MIEPTVGRLVHFRPGRQATTLRVQYDPKQPLAAIVAYVHTPRSVNLDVIDALGRHHAFTNVRLLQDDDKGTDDEPFAEWMPFQKGQAQKTEQAEKALAGAVPPSVVLVDDEAGACFSSALSWLKQGRKVTRAPWAASGVFVYHVPADSYPARTPIAKAAFGEDAVVPYMAYLAIKRADGNVCVFVPGMDSMLAEDWIVVE